jgi:hypothetical protein
VIVAYKSLPPNPHGEMFVGMFYRQRMLVIDGKYNNDDGLSTTTMISSAVIIGEEQQP